MLHISTILDGFLPLFSSLSTCVQYIFVKYGKIVGFFNIEIWTID